MQAASKKKEDVTNSHKSQKAMAKSVNRTAGDYTNAGSSFKKKKKVSKSDLKR